MLCLLMIRFHQVCVRVCVTIEWDQSNICGETNHPKHVSSKAAQTDGQVQQPLPAHRLSLVSQLHLWPRVTFSRAGF